MHIEIYLEDWNDLVAMAKEARYQIFSEVVVEEKSHRLWLATTPADSVATVFMALISQESLDKLNEEGAVPNRKVVRATIEVIHE